MQFLPLNLAGAYQIDPDIFSDSRGSFCRFYDEEKFKAIGHSKKWAQVNHSYTAKSATVRGMHFQLPPYAEIKMVKCIAGKIFDVIVDVRKDSNTFLQWQGLELSAENKRSLFIPEGFAHGFQTLTDDCELIYFHSEPYQPIYESAIRYNDPIINIRWPLPAGFVSERDGQHPLITNDFTGIKLK